MATTARVAGQFNNVHYTKVQAVSQPVASFPCKTLTFHGTPLHFTSQSITRRNTRGYQHQCTFASTSGPATSVRLHVNRTVRQSDSSIRPSLLQLILEKIFLALGGMFMVVGAGLHIAKEVGWLVSKGGDLSLHPLLRA